MAGGPFAQVIPCDGCASMGVRAPATRVTEGSENDRYRCASGHTFIIHWRQIASAPLWVDPEELRQTRVAQTAYFLWLARIAAGAAGDATSDWLEAEARERST